jgi:hypothetical protein
MVLFFFCTFFFCLAGEKRTYKGQYIRGLRKSIVVGDSSVPGPSLAFRKQDAFQIVRNGFLTHRIAPIPIAEAIR